MQGSSARHKVSDPYMPSNPAVNVWDLPTAAITPAQTSSYLPQTGYKRFAKGSRSKVGQDCCAKSNLGPGLGWLMTANLQQPWSSINQAMPT
ncbi:hypothetical protein PISMIDRAFT_370853 [Pisolithus microcarpus 441]|uniref:Uncharacterized protein n=1 Tax=Pisolithus microcarpus 441 TaxID=765257 RepID=A0A0C9Z1T3_9AGAM|nr:hypothetical protein PISMIDRAFT_370853 [Pisolithus microcarpus 441]